MNFEFSEDQEMLRQEARKFLGEQCTTEAVRRVLDGEATHDEKLWSSIVEMGWTATALPEACGGFGMGYLELCVIAEELGRAVAPVPFSSAVYLAGESLLAAGSEAQQAEWLPKLAAGEAIGTLALAETAGAVTMRKIRAQVSKGKLTGTKTPVPDASIADYAVVAAKDAQGVSLYLADLNDDGVRRDTLATVDPTRDAATLTFEDVPVEPLGQPGKGLEYLEGVLDRAAVLLAFEQIGGAQAALEMGVAYAKERYAFGRPIGSFQAIKHRLAEMFVSLELARSNCYYGAWALSTGAKELPVAAATARVAASQAYSECARENTQVHGGMGFTWEGDCHLHYRRAKLLNLILGGERVWKDKLIQRLQARREPEATTLSAA
ncbi:MAG: acyl-CoA/acyl-ACP dehydrogenase [Gammaproteobacteria bacterium]